MWGAICWRGKLKFSPQAVFPFMQETMWWHGKLKIDNRKSSFGCGKNSPVVGNCPVGMCLVLVPNIGISTSISNNNKNTPTALHKLHVCPLGMCVVLVQNIGTSTIISNTTQICSQHLKNFICVH